MVDFQQKTIASASERASNLNVARDANPIPDNNPGVWVDTEILSWTPDGGETVNIPAKVIEESGGNRLVVRARPHRAGAKLDSTGGKEVEFSITALFWNGCNEPGLDPNIPVYPDLCHLAIDSFKYQSTGDLVTPTRGRIRCRASTYRKTETSEGDYDAAAVVFTFITDNEDDVGTASVSKMTARTSGPRIAVAAQFDADDQGLGGDGGMPDLIDKMNQLRGIIEAPGVAIEDATATARAIVRNIEKIVTSFSDATEPARAVFVDADSHRLRRKLIKLQDAVFDADVINPRGGARRATTQKSFTTNRSIFDIAADLGQDPLELEDLNRARIEDMQNIEAGTIVRVYA